MAGINLFQNPSTTLPKSDAQIIRVDMEQSDIAGRKSHLPAAQKADTMSITHVPNAGSAPGSK